MLEVSEGIQKFSAFDLLLIIVFVRLDKTFRAIINRCQPLVPLGIFIFAEYKLRSMFLTKNLLKVLVME
jgi:hypothetical protein